MKTMQTVLLAGLLALTLACGYTSKGTTPPVAGAIPAITALVPNNTNAGGSDMLLTVNGDTFNVDAMINWNGTALATTYVTAGQLTATVPAADIATAGSAAVTVTNPGHAGGGIYGSGGTTAETSGPMTFTIN